MAQVWMQLWDSKDGETVAASVTIDPPIEDGPADEALTRAQFIGALLRVFLKDKDVQVIGDYPGSYDEEDLEDL